MYNIALAMKVVESKKCLFDGAFSNSDRECTATVGLQVTEAGDVGSKNVGDEANVRTMVARIVGRIV